MDQFDISIIIPTLNEEAHIGGVLDAIKQHCDARLQYEVIVVDNGSSDRTLEVVGEKGAITLYEPKGSISSLRNLGASKARADILVFLDADVYPKNAWGRRIELVVERLHNQPSIITGSFCGVSSENNWIERIWFSPRATLKKINYMNSGHMIIHRSLFSRVGGFNIALETGEDYEFCSRARKMGALIKNDPELEVMHAGYPKNLTRFFTRERWHARGDYISLRSVVDSKPALVSIANFCVVASCTIGIVLWPWLWYLFSSVPIVFLVAVSLGATCHRCREGANSSFWAVVFLYMVYFTARTVSLCEVVVGRFLERRPASASRES